MSFKIEDVKSKLSQNRGDKIAFKPNYFEVNFYLTKTDIYIYIYVCVCV